MEDQEPFRLVVCDLDGTLLDGEHSGGSFSEETKKVLKQVISFACPLVLATARGISELPPLDGLPEPLFLILYGEAVRAAEAEGASLWLFQPDQVHIKFGAKSVHAKLEDLEAVLAEDRSLEVVAVLPEPDAAKERLERRLQGAGMQVDVLSQAPDPFVSIKASGVDKGSGLRRLCAHLALTPSFAVAFGDGGNDIPLLTTAGYGVAVANARETLKAVASKTSTWRNTEDAVAQELLLLAQRRLLAATRGAAVNAR
eukprot:g28019.t1